MLVPINITGGVYKHKSRPLSNQLTRNWWPQAQGTQKARSDYILQTFYGLKLFVTHAGGSDRGMVTNQGKLYKVTDGTLYQVDSLGIHTALGSIPGSNRCIMKALGSQIVIANGSGQIWVWDGTVLSQNTNVNLGSPKGVAVLNSQAIYDNGSGQSFDVSDVGLPSSISGLNNAAAESFSDDLQIPYAWRETLYLFGKETIELWYNSGQGNPPFDKVQGAGINVGLGAVYSVADMPDFAFFFGSDKQFHSLTPGTSAVDTVVSNAAMAKEFQTYLVTDDCIGWCMQLEGQWFYVAVFPTQDITWIYPVGGDWFQWGSSATGRIRANSYAQVFGKNLVAEYNSGNIYELDAETYTDADQAIIRTRDSAIIHSGLIGPDNKPFEVNEIQFIVETGVGLLSGQGQYPKLIFSTSRDGGKTFGTERFINIGTLGQEVMVSAKNLGRFSQVGCVLRVRFSDPTYCVVYAVNIDMEICI